LGHNRRSTGTIRYSMQRAYAQRVTGPESLRDVETDSQLSIDSRKIGRGKKPHGAYLHAGKHTGAIAPVQEAREAVSTIRMRSAAFLAPSFFMILAR
jgi:hypothetical protein